MLHFMESQRIGHDLTGTNINNLRYADDTTLMAESEEELKGLLMKVKVESEKVSFHSNPKERQCQRMIKLEKAEEPEIKWSTSAGSWKKAREFQKNIYFCFIDYAKAFECVSQ